MSVVTLVRERTSGLAGDRQPGVPSTATSGIGARRRLLTLALAAAALVLPLIGWGGLASAVALLFYAGLLATVVAPPAGSQNGRLSLLHWLPASFMFALVVPTALGLLSSLLGAPVWGGRLSALIGWSLAICVPMAIGLRRSGRVLVAPDRSTVVVVSAMLTLIAATLTWQPFGVWSRVVSLGTDFPRHVEMLRQIASAGGLDYSADAYPRAIHASLAMLQQAAGAATSGSAWQATEGWLLIAFALMAAGTGMLAARIMRALGGPAWTASIAAPLLGCLLMVSGPFVTGMMPFGFLTSFGAGLILVAAAILFWDGHPAPSAAAAVGLIVLTALMAHMWLLLLPLVALPTLRVVVPVLRRGAAAIPIVLAGVAALLLAAPVVVATVVLVGIDGAATPGGHGLPLIGKAWVALLLAALACIALMHQRRVAQQGYLLLIAAMLGVVGLLLPHSFGGYYQAYYLTKSIWTPLGVLLALAIPGTLWLLVHTAKPVRIVVAATVAAGLAVTQPVALVQSYRTLHGDVGLPALVLPMVDELQGPDSTGAARPEALVWRLLPPHTSKAATINVDLTAQGVLPFAGYPLGDPGPVYEALFNNDPRGMCEVLAQHPDALRVTGSDLEGPLNALTDVGCPEDVVRTDQWLSIEFSESWFVGSRWQKTPSTPQGG